jgi:hypothetical protein
MAKQSGHINFQGTIGGITYVKTPDGYYARPKTVIPKSRFATDPRFEQQRENNAEFKKAANAGKIIRHALRSYLEFAKDRKTAIRLTTEMLKVVKADTINESGKRKVLGSQTEKLAGFNFNETAPLSAIFRTDFTTAIDRLSGKLEVAVPSFVPLKDVSGSEGATHCKLVSAGLDIDFDNETLIENKSESALIPLSAAAFQPVTLTNTIPTGSANPQLLVLGIQFYKEVNGVSKIIKSGSCNALALVSVSGS